ncbi:methionine--tRNA ligase, partial [Candidatus Woesearchaeota archaeon]|nr:methionine--tRNA ligase [Candidatus Woesearchaeota archaeon]
MVKPTEKIIITAALPYANGPIHIGHLLEYIQADIFTRFLKLQGKDALYICASDMHGAPIEVNAQKVGMTPEVFVEKYWKEHQEDFASYQIAFDNYYKTHSLENKQLAEHFFLTLKKKGLIYTKKMNTIFCPHCVRYLPDRFVRGTCPHCATGNQYGDVCESCSSTLKGTDLVNPKCSLCGRTPMQKESMHYFFALSKFGEQLRSWMKTADLQQEVVHQLKEWLDKRLEDWCISRDAPYFGFEIPDSEKETREKKYFYVWLDAPIGYISSTQNLLQKKSVSLKKSSVSSIGSVWETYWKKGRVYHFIGKDIMYFHFLFWPAMLMAMEIPLPSLTVHGFITVNGEKMSKSRGTFLTAKDFLKLYPAEALRFFYASHLDKKVIDVNLDFEEVKEVNNSILLGSLGNFCYRVLTFAQQNYGAVTEIAKENDEKKEDEQGKDVGLQRRISELVVKIQQYYLTQDFKSAVKEILILSDLGNAYFQKSEVWKKKEAKESKAAVGFCVNLAKNLAVLISPILPEFSLKIARALGKKKLVWNDIDFSWKGKLNYVEKLVEKIETVAEMKISKEVPLIGYVVSPEVEELGVKVRLAQLSGLTIKKKNEGIEKLKKKIQEEITHYEKTEVLEEYRKIDNETGVDSQKHPNAVVNLITLIKNKRKLPQINTVVDLYNVVSVETSLALATHDLSKLEGKIYIRFSREGETFLSLDGTSEKLKAGEIVYADDHKIIGRFSKQCKQTLTTTDSTDIVLVAFGNAKISESEMDKAVEKTCTLITQYNGGKYKILPTVKPPEFPLRMLVGKILEVKNHPQADSLYLLKVDLGKEMGMKQVVAGLKKYFSEKELLDRKAVFCVNI